MKHFMIAITVYLLALGTAHAENAAMPMMNNADLDRTSAVKTSNITVSNFTFAPLKISVPVGAKVTWTNKDDTVQRVMIIETKAKSAALDTDGSFSTTFDQPGTYHYFCTLHPMMKGTIEVTAVK